MGLPTAALEVGELRPAASVAADLDALNVNPAVLPPPPTFELPPCCSLPRGYTCQCCGCNSVSCFSVYSVSNTYHSCGSVAGVSGAERLCGVQQVQRDRAVQLLLSPTRAARDAADFAALARLLGPDQVARGTARGSGDATWRWYVVSSVDSEEFRCGLMSHSLATGARPGRLRHRPWQ